MAIWITDLDTWVVVLTVVTEAKDCPTSQADKCAKEVVISRKRTLKEFPAGSDKLRPKFEKVSHATHVSF